MSRLFIHAQDFLNAYEILRESNDALMGHTKDRASNGSGQVAYGARPAMGIEIVCLAFSVELHLKELHRVITGKVPKGHNIDKIFRNLPKPIQKDVASCNLISQYGWSDTQMQSELISISDGFEKWRYAHENTSLKYNVYFARALIQAVCSVISKETFPNKSS